MIRVQDSAMQMPVPPDPALPESFTLGFRPEDVLIAPDGEFSGRVTLIEPLGAETVVHIKSGNCDVLSSVNGIATFPIGSEVRYRIIQERLHFFNNMDGGRLNKPVQVR
jgi:multiple sugar transport system ATP-binding protein